jgi:glycosyltransferase involved in cell wall biosynthesis
LSATTLEFFEIVTVSDHPEADIKWSLEAVRGELLRADLAIIPVGEDHRSTMKSHNRATMFMAAGIPLIVSESPVYEKLVEDGVTGFVFKTIHDLTGLPARLATAGLVDCVKAAAMERAKVYSIESVVGLWKQFLNPEATNTPAA